MISKITQGKEEDIPHILELFVRCTDLMLENDIKQWDYSYPNQQTTLSDVTGRECYILKENGTCLATITLNAQQDKQYQDVKWAFESDQVLVIHRLAVHPKAQGRGLGTLITQFAEHFAKENNYEVIRLDAYQGNEVSNRIYRKLGYSLANGLCYFHGNELPFNCYEKRVEGE